MHTKRRHRHAVLLPVLVAGFLLPALFVAESSPFSGPAVRREGETIVAGTARVLPAPGTDIFTVQG
jgi:hypothetical protein